MSTKMSKRRSPNELELQIVRFICLFKCFIKYVVYILSKIKLMSIDDTQRSLFILLETCELFIKL
jgi:hypothetical protein